MNALIVIFIISYLLYSFSYDWKFLGIFLSLTAVYHVLTQTNLILKSEFKGFRNKFTVATWYSPDDPHIYGKVKLNIKRMMPYLERKAKESNLEKITITLFTIKLIALLLNKYPSLSSYVRLY